MSEEHAKTLDYEKTISELREHRTRLVQNIDDLVNECDRMRVLLRNRDHEIHAMNETSTVLLRTIEQLRSENERLKIALQTGEQ
jgi:hypothetical protein